VAAAGPALDVLSLDGALLHTLPFPTPSGATVQTDTVPTCPDGARVSLFVAPDGQHYLVGCEDGEAPDLHTTAFWIDPTWATRPRVVMSAANERIVGFLPDGSWVTMQPLPLDQPLDQNLGADSGFEPDGDPWEIRARRPPAMVSSKHGDDGAVSLGSVLMGERALCASNGEVVVGQPGTLGDEDDTRGTQLLAIGPGGATRVVARQFGFLTIEPIAVDATAGEAGADKPLIAYSVASFIPAAPPERALHLQVTTAGFLSSAVGPQMLTTFDAADDTFAGAFSADGTELWLTVAPPGPTTDSTADQTLDPTPDRATYSLYRLRLPRAGGLAPLPTIGQPSPWTGSSAPIFAADGSAAWLPPQTVIATSKAGGALLLAGTPKPIPLHNVQLVVALQPLD
jgi:hypothetical protein